MSDDRVQQAIWAIESAIKALAAQGWDAQKVYREVDVIVDEAFPDGD